VANAPVPPLRLRDADRLEKSIEAWPERADRPGIVILVGLPGSGKSSFARALSACYPAVILDSDRLRAILFPAPEHTERENRRLFPAIHLLIGRLLGRGLTVIVDATNLKEANRKPYYALAKTHGARLVLVRVWAPPSVIRERLAGRESGADENDWSSATLEVHARMRRDVERITRRHVSVNTVNARRPYLDKVIRLLQS
jgi:predicted kinase